MKTKAQKKKAKTKQRKAWWEYPIDLKPKRKKPWNQPAIRLKPKPKKRTKPVATKKEKTKETPVEEKETPAEQKPEEQTQPDLPGAAPAAPGVDHTRHTIFPEGPEPPK